MSYKKLAVIGGGAAGHQIAYALKEFMEVTLIDPKTYWEVPMALPRLLAEPTALPARMTYASFLPGVRHVQGRAQSMSDHQVVVDAGASIVKISFDYAVLTPGSRYLDPLIKAEVTTDLLRRAQIEEAHALIRRARTLVVAGGGPVGVETAAELRETFPELRITLVHGASKLLETAPSRFGAWAERSLRERGIEILLNDMVVAPQIGSQPADRKVRTRGGLTVEADFLIWAAGTRPNSEFIAASWPELVEPNGLVKTDPYLRLQGHPDIFVAGDITNLPEARLVIIASMHVPSIVSNLKVLLDQGAAATLKPYSPKLPGKGLGKMMVVTLGRRDGLSSLPFGQFRASFIARKIKAEHMFVPKYRKAVGLT